jgi:hypothetical protein
MPGETAKAYNAFCLFRDQFERRTLSKVAQMLSCSQQNVARRAIQWDWADRCRAYDRHLDELQRTEQTRERLLMRKRQIQAGMELQDIGESEIAELQKRVDEGLPLNLTPAAICKLIEVGAKLERSALGEDAGSKFRDINVIFERSDDDGATNGCP